MDTEYTSPIIEEFDDPTDTFKDNEFVYTYAILAVVGVVAITFGAVLIEMVSLDADGKPVYTQYGGKYGFWWQRFE